MEITLPDGKKAIVISQIGKFTNLKLEDGQEVIWPTEKLPKPDKEPEQIKVVIIPAIDRLEKLVSEKNRLERSDVLLAGENCFDEYNKLHYELKMEALREFRQKWGLT